MLRASYRKCSARAFAESNLSQVEENLMIPILREQVDSFFEYVLLDDIEEEPCQILPEEIVCTAAAEQDFPCVLEWPSGPIPAPEILDTKYSNKLDRTFLHEAAFEGRTVLMHLLLPYGANVDQEFFGKTVSLH